MGPVSISNIYCKISQSLEPARLGVVMLISLWNLTGVSLARTATEKLVKFQSDWKTLNRHIAPLGLYEILRWDMTCDVETGPRKLGLTSHCVALHIIRFPYDGSKVCLSGVFLSVYITHWSLYQFCMYSVINIELLYLYSDFFCVGKETSTNWTSCRMYTIRYNRKTYPVKIFLRWLLVVNSAIRKYL